MPALTGVLETALYVDDLPRAVAFYQDVFDLKPMIIDERICALDVAGKQVLLLFKRGASRAGRTTAAGLCTWRSRLTPPNCRRGRNGCGRTGSTWKTGRSGSAVERACTSAIRTGTCSNWRHRACGPVLAALAGVIEGGGAILEELLLPEGEAVNGEAVLLTDVGDGLLLQEVEAEQGDLLRGGVVTALPGHGCSSARVLPRTPAKANSRSD